MNFNILDDLITVLLTCLIASVCSGVLGAGFGWLMHNLVSGTHLEMELVATRSQKARERGRQEVERENSAGLMSELMLQLAELTSGVASEVGKHTGNIEAINAELADVQQDDAGAVVAAVQKILKANAAMQQELAVAETRLQEQQRELLLQTEAARTDPLTKITNRRALDEELKKCVLEFQRTAQPFTVMVLDVDRFKRVNDTHGHMAGDEILKSVAQTINSQVRESELVARYGGEEFVVIFRGENIAACRERGDMLRASINERSLTFEGKELRVAASAGLAEIGVGDDEKSLIRRADQALYISKKAGRNCAHWNDGQTSLPITPALLAKLASDGTGQAPPKHEAIKLRKLDFHDVRFSDASFSPNLDRRVAEWQRTGHIFSIAVCAIDRYEQLQKEHGDDLLQRMVTATASAVSSCLRDTDQVAAYGNSGFAVSLPAAQMQDAALVADRMRKAVERLYVPAGVLPQFTVSIGVAQVIEGNDSSRLFDRAQRALDAAQAGSGNRTMIHDGLHAVPAIGMKEAVPA